MAAPGFPSIEHLGERPFSFYPAIIGVDHNEWIFRRATWSEMLVLNRTSRQEVWIPRRFVGEVSRIDEPVVIIGLTKELEFRGGMVVPHERRVIEIPRAGIQDPAAPQPNAEVRPAPIVGIRLEGGAESRVGRMLAAAIAVGILVCIALVAFLSSSGKRVSYHAVLQTDPGFTGNDDYFSIVNKLGRPALDQWRPAQGEIQYRRLEYAQQGISMVLMGSDRKDMHYIGSLDKDWKVVHAVNANAEAMLRHLKRF